MPRKLYKIPHIKNESESDNDINKARKLGYLSALFYFEGSRSILGS